MSKLGRTNVEVTPLCLGGNVFGWTTDEHTSFQVLDAYIEAGGNFIDTADVYSAWVPGHQGGESEAVLGKWLHARQNRERVVLATKVGMLNAKPGSANLSRENILQAVDHSLRRLQTDYIDLYFAHRDDSQTPLEETLSIFAELVKAGKVRVLGASNYSAPRLAEALQISATHNFPRYEVLQPLYNLLDRSAYEGELADLCVKQEISVVPYSSLASGFLTGKYRRDAALPKTPRAGGVQQRYWNDRSFALLDSVLKVAAQLNATPTQVALAWLLTRPAVVAPIASATSVEQTRELMGALKVKLDQAALDALENAKIALS